MSAETLSIVRAQVQRAQREKASSVTLNLHDVLELLPSIEAGMHRSRMESPMKFAGWANPRDIQSLSSRKTGDRAIKLRAFRTDAFNTELFFSGSLREKVREYDAIRQQPKGELDTPVPPPKNREPEVECTS